MTLPDGVQLYLATDNEVAAGAALRAVAAAASERYQAAMAAERAGGKRVSDPRVQPGMAIPPRGMRLSLHSGGSVTSGGVAGTSGGSVTSGAGYAAGGGYVTGSGGSGGGGGGGAWGSGGSVHVTPGLVYGAGGSGSWQSPADFDHGGELDLPAPPDSEAFAAGSVTGYRWWRMTAPDFTRSPLDADRDWPQKGLCGQYDYWQPGVNHADCKSSARNHEPGTIPVLSCRCGYWAYWEPQQHDLSGSGEIAVFGVIKGWGKVLLGRKGFRAGTARLIAVYVASSLVPRYPDGAVRIPDGSGEIAIPGSLGGALARNPRFTGKIYNYGAGPDRYERAAPYSPTPRQLLAAETHAEAWLAVIGDRIGQMYPGTDICETRDRMLAKYPSTPQYAPAAAAPDAPCRHGQPRRDCLTCFILG